MKKFYITKYIAVAATVEADTATDAVARFEDSLTSIYLDGKAPERGLSFGDSGEPATVKEYFPGTALVANIGSIAGGEFVPAKHYANA